MANEKTPSQLPSLLSIYAGKVGKNLELVQSIGVTPSKSWVSPLREQIKKTNSNWDQFSTLLRSLYELKKKESFSQDDLKQSLIIDLTLSFILCNHPYDDTQTHEKFNALLSECATICPDPFLDELQNWHTQTINDLPLLSGYLAKQTNYRNYIHQIVGEKARSVDSTRLAQILTWFAKHNAVLCNETTFIGTVINFLTGDTYTLPESLTQFIQFLAALTENHKFSHSLACQIKNQLLAQQINEQSIENEENITEFLIKLNVLHTQCQSPPLVNPQGTADLCQRGAKQFATLDLSMISHLAHQLIQRVATHKNFTLDFAKSAIAFFLTQKNTDSLFILLFDLAKSPEFVPMVEQAFQNSLLPLATLAEYESLLNHITALTSEKTHITRWINVTLPIFSERPLDSRESIAFLTLYEKLKTQCQYKLPPNITASPISRILTQQATELTLLTANLATFAISPRVHESMRRLDEVNLLIETSFSSDYQYLKNEQSALKAKLEKKQIRLANQQKNPQKIKLSSLLRGEKSVKKLNRRLTLLQQKARLLELNLAQQIEQIEELNRQQYTTLLNDCKAWDNRVFKLQNLAQFKDRLAQTFTHTESPDHPLKLIVHEPSLTESFQQTKDLIETTQQNQPHWSKKQNRLFEKLKGLEASIHDPKQCLSLRPQLVSLADALNQMTQAMDSANETIEKNLLATQKIGIETITGESKKLEAAHATQRLELSIAKIEITQLRQGKDELTRLQTAQETLKTELENRIKASENECTTLENSLRDVNQSIDTLTGTQAENKKQFKKKFLSFANQVLPIFDETIQKNQWSIAYVWACFIVFLFGKTDFDFVKENKTFLETHETAIETRDQLSQMHQEKQLDGALSEVHQSTLNLEPLLNFFTTHQLFTKQIEIAGKINQLVQNLKIISSNNASLIEKKLNRGDTQRNLATTQNTLKSLREQFAQATDALSDSRQKLDTVEAKLQNKNEKKLKIENKLKHLEQQKLAVNATLAQLQSANAISNDTAPIGNNEVTVGSEPLPLPIPIQIDTSEGVEGETNPLSIEETLAMFPDETIEAVFEYEWEKTEAMLQEKLFNVIELSKVAASHVESPLYAAWMNENSFFHKPIIPENIPAILDEYHRLKKND